LQSKLDFESHHCIDVANVKCGCIVFAVVFIWC